MSIRVAGILGQMGGFIYIPETQPNAQESSQGNVPDPLKSDPC